MILKKLHQYKIDSAVLDTKQEMVDIFQDRARRAHEKINRLANETKEQMLDLAQATMNLQFIDAFQSAEPPNSEKEIEDLTDTTRSHLSQI